MNFNIKNNKLKKLSCSLQSAQKDLKQTKDHVTSLIGENVIRSNQLGLELGQLMGNENQFKILKEQKKLLGTSHDILIDEIKHCECRTDRFSNRFHYEVKKFLFSKK